MAAKLTDFSAAVREYEEKYRSPSMSPFEISEPYDLFPDKGGPAVQCAGKWPEKWPHADSAGIYVFLNDNLEVVYVGKASFRSVLGARLSSYCGHAPDKSCHLYHKWTSMPRYVVTVAVPNDTRFEAPALEEYLIERLQPSDNSTGIDR